MVKRSGSKLGDAQGNWFNPETRETLRPDVDHPEPYGPHYDYRTSDGRWHRWSPNGTVTTKLGRTSDTPALVGKDLHEQGRRFTNWRLDSGGILSHAVIDLRGPVASAVAPLPSGFDPANVTSFDHSGPTSLGASIDWLVDEVQRPYSRSSPFLVLIEDSWASLSEASDDERERRFRVSDDCLVYALPSDRFSVPALEGVLRLVHSFYFSGFILETATMPALPVRGIAVDELAKHVKQVFVNAFDQDGLILSDWAER